MVDSKCLTYNHIFHELLGAASVLSKCSSGCLIYHNLSHNSLSAHLLILAMLDVSIGHPSMSCEILA